MAILGPRDLSYLIMMTGWDATSLQNFKLEDGTTYDLVAGMLQTALAGVNSEISSNWMSAMFSVTDQLELDYRVGVSNGFERHTEYARGDQKRSDQEGHMLPLIPYDRLMGWTWDFLRKARMSQIENDITDFIKDVRDLVRVQMLTRCLKRTDDSGSANGLGTGGYSTGFATADASTSVDYQPPAYGGTTFSSGHEHYVATAGGAATQAIFTAAYENLFEHGHQPPFEFLASTDDQATIEGLTGFTPVEELNVRYGLTQDIATLNRSDIGYGVYYIGTLAGFNVRIVRGMPQYYGFGYKSYGSRSQRNPLRVRVAKGQSALNTLLMKSPQLPTGQLPIQNVMGFNEFGVGVGDRTGGTAQYWNSGTWADGTPT